MGDLQARWQAAIRELSNADRAYRAAFQTLTSDGGLAPSSYEALLGAVERLSAVVQHLQEALVDADDPVESRRPVS